MKGGTGESMARRYPMSFALRYVLATRDEGRTGAGETVWMSGSEVAFVSKGATSVGEKITLHIEWPVMLGGEVPLQLTAMAEVVQCTAPLSVARITKFEFRTRGSQASALQSSSLGLRNLVLMPALNTRPAYAGAARAYSGEARRSVMGSALGG
jgi:hypothetical protein